MMPGPVGVAENGGAEEVNGAAMAEGADGLAEGADGLGDEGVEGVDDDDGDGEAHHEGHRRADVLGRYAWAMARMMMGR